MHSKVLAVTCTTFVIVMAALALNVGEPAPPLEAKKWFNGDAVNPAAPDGKTFYVIEFWATWCPPCKKSIPHLNELHEKYSDQGIVIVGVTTEPEKTVKPFMDKIPMKYRVALASTEEIQKTWMKNVEGIPHAFVVNTNGVVIWQGHPMDRLDQVLADIVAGSFDPEKYKNAEEESDTDLETLQQYLMEGQFEQALSFIEEKLKDNPDLRLYQMKMGLLLQLERSDQLKETYREIVERFWDKDKELNMAAWMAATAPFELRDLEIAWEAANRAVDLSERKDAAILDTLAVVYYFLGRLPEAIRLQEEAVQKAADGSEAKQLQTTLDYYRKAWQFSEKLEQKE